MASATIKVSRLVPNPPFTLLELCFATGAENNIQQGIFKKAGCCSSASGLVSEMGDTWLGNGYCWHG
ncbi:hypothetical protein CEXT_254211 [Caerostris extrusa]|uniref:Uncharacterized protein n=1 Tax=Caerostris extrusa TaxID=172846 RepID=A0AAV4X036_CAEEX|nr:hypothetical protein CEXT_254211 [Caerostris extrusa]